MQELNSELSEGQRRLSNAEKEKLLLQKTLNEDEQKIDELLHSSKVSEQKVREQAGSLSRLRPHSSVFRMYQSLC